MKKLIRVSLITSLLLTSFNVMAAKAPIQSKEEIEFQSKTEEKMLAMMKSDDFLGVITRIAMGPKDTSVVDLYAFKGVKELAMTKELCNALLARIYGDPKDISLKIKSVELFKSHTGNTCEAQIDTPDRLSKIPERRTLIGFVNAQPYALVFKLSKKSTPADQEDTKKFWESLR